MRLYDSLTKAGIKKIDSSKTIKIVLVSLCKRVSYLAFKSRGFFLIIVGVLTGSTVATISFIETFTTPPAFFKRVFAL